MPTLNTHPAPPVLPLTVLQVYVVYFKTIKHFIREYSKLREYVKDIYQVGEDGRICWYCCG
jgi:hypothetical protein